MRNSDIFDDYIKIAIEKGLVSTAEKEKLTKKEPRESEVLYNVKCDSDKDMSYENNIMEIAHKGNVIIAPAHDKINGLVENNIERQNIILNIINRKSNGNVTHHKYAKQELLMSLVRIANDMDNKDKEQLRSLADNCLGNLSKVAVAPLIGAAGWVAITAATSLLGVLYANQHMDNANEGFEHNHANLVKEIDDLINSEISWGVGYELDAELKQIMTNLKNKLEQFYSIYTSVKQVLANIQKPKDTAELLEIAKSPESDAIQKAYNRLNSAFNYMKPYMDQVEKNLKSNVYKASHIKDTGVITKTLDWMKLHGGKGLVADDFTDILNAIPPYKTSIQEIITIFKDAESYKKDALRQLEAAKSQQDAASQSQTESGQDDGLSAIQKQIQQDEEEISKK